METFDEWHVIYYKTLHGEKPVYEFIQHLDETSKAKIINVINLLAQYGVAVKGPHIKKLRGTNLWELRTVGKDNIRIFYVTWTGKTFLLLHGFKKKKQKTATKEIAIALKRFENYKARVVT